MNGENALILASQYYKDNLRQNPNCQLAKYITEKRKFNPTTIATFGVGISYNAIGMSVWDYLKNKGCEENVAEEYGIICESNGAVTDCMRNRFTIEIKDVCGKLVGFTARVLGTPKRFKYLNTKATPCFQKSKIVFNLDKAKYYIDYFAKPYLILVEGHCDVMSLWQNGIRNVSAIMGTACTEYHAKLIKMFCRDVVLCLDTDDAGVEATVRSTRVLTEQGINVHRMFLPKGKDADEFMQMKDGAEIFKNLAQNAMNI